MTRNGFGMDSCIFESMGDTIIILFAGEKGYYCNVCTGIFMNVRTAVTSAWIVLWYFYLIYEGTRTSFLGSTCV